MLLFNMLLLSITLVYAHGNFNETKQLIAKSLLNSQIYKGRLKNIQDAEKLIIGQKTGKRVRVNARNRDCRERPEYHQGH